MVKEKEEEAMSLRNEADNLKNGGNYKYNFKRIIFIFNLDRAKAFKGFCKHSQTSSTQEIVGAGGHEYSDKRVW